MGEHTTIEWVGETGKTFNPWLGCTPVHTGCKNCYAQAYFRRMGILNKRRKTSEVYWKKPLTWNRKAAAAGVRIRVFPSLCDPFDGWTSNAPPGNLEYLRGKFFDLIDATPNLDWLLLTKRPENIRKMWPGRRGGPIRGASQLGLTNQAMYRDNVFLLYSASDQETLDAGLPHLLGCGDLVNVLGVSLEPLIGPVEIREIPCSPGEAQYNAMAGQPPISFCIVGGESGPHARPCKVEWIRSVVEQCRDAGVRCFVKQDSGPKPGTQGRIPDHYGGARAYVERPKGDETQHLIVDEFVESAIDQGQIAEGGRVLDDLEQLKQIKAAEAKGGDDE